MTYFKKGRRFRDELLTIEKIGKWFLKPLLDRKEHQTSDSVFLEHVVFQTRFREITKYRAAVTFDLPGIRLQSPNVKVQGLPARISRGAIVVVRHDHRENVFHVSHVTDRGMTEHVSELTHSEWEKVLPYLREVTHARCA